MKDLTEPMSKCAQFVAIRAATTRFFFADTNLQVAEGLHDEAMILMACEDFDAARRDLMSALIAAEVSGLLDEISGYLTATYGG